MNGENIDADSRRNPEFLAERPVTDIGHEDQDPRIIQLNNTDNNLTLPRNRTTQDVIEPTSNNQPNSNEMWKAVPVHTMFAEKGWGLCANPRKKIWAENSNFISKKKA